MSSGEELTDIVLMECVGSSRMWVGDCDRVCYMLHADAVFNIMKFRYACRTRGTADERWYILAERIAHSPFLLLFIYWVFILVATEIS